MLIKFIEEQGFKFVEKSEIHLERGRAKNQADGGDEGEGAG